MEPVARSEFPVIRTSRFLLRQITRDDIAAIFQGLSDPRVHSTCGVSYDTLQATQRQMDWYEALYANGTGIWWAICANDKQPDLLGTCGFSSHDCPHRRAEIGYWLLPENWGRGMAGECVAAVVSHGFEVMGLHRISADVDVGNHRSSQLLERLGFRFEGIRRGCEFKQGRFLDLQCYSRLSSDPA